MLKTAVTRSALFALLFCAADAWSASSLSSLQDSFAEVAASAKPAVVNITAVHNGGEAESPEFYFGNPEDFMEQFYRGHPHHPRINPRQMPIYGTGSGALIDPRGYVVTNNHVVEGADEIKVTLTGPDGKGKTLPGKVVGRDPGMDLAVIKIKKEGTYPYLKLGDSSKIKVGHWAIAIGSPFELEETVTVGVISAVRQSLAIESHRYHNLIQTDAAINRGNSGGPLLNIEGEIIGINTAIFSPSGASAGIGFAIPVNEAKESINALMEGKTIRRGWLGVDLGPVKEEDAEGALIAKVVDDSPASKAGLKRGDVVLKFDGQAVESPDALAYKVGRAVPGKTVTLSVKRNGKDQDLQVTLGERPDWAEEGARRRYRDE